jgi:hypothetical protein
MKGRVRWYYDSLTPRAAAFVLLADQAVQEILEAAAEAVQQYAQENAPWEDQSGAAREGLTAEYQDLGLFEHAIILYHTVEYGIWLEVRWNGKYAIIIPTIERMGPIVMAATTNMFGDMG